MKRSSFTSLIALVALAASSCKKEEKEAPPAPAPAPAEGSAAEPAPGAEPAAAPAEVEAALAAYERMRASLAKDEVAAVSEDAAALAEAAGGAAASASDIHRGHLEALAAAAETMRDMPVEDSEAVRKAFGDVSRPLVAMLSADPKLAEGRHVFECPMSQGYPKWVQVSPEIENPYMGTRMLACGGASDWTP
jgi:membrane fusion protein, copper/silver efflux system